jgi:hypothetical protein
MMKRTTFVISALCLLIVANLLMISYASPAFLSSGEGFVGHMDKKKEHFVSEVDRSVTKQVKNVVETFQNFTPAGAKTSYEPIGAFDGINLAQTPGSWRQNSPNEPLLGNFPKFEPGPDNLFMFKDNQVKPDCCGSSFSSHGGCLCTTPDQRNYINMRGGNRTSPDAGV